MDELVLLPNRLCGEKSKFRAKISKLNGAYLAKNTPRSGLQFVIKKLNHGHINNYSNI